MALKLTKENQEARKVDNMLRLINRRIQYVNEISPNGSPLLESVEEILHTFNFQHDAKGSVIGDEHSLKGLKRSKKVVDLIQQSPRLKKGLEKIIDTLQSPSDIKKELIKKYEEETGKQLRTRKEKEAAFIKMKERIATVKSNLSNTLQSLYALEKKSEYRQYIPEIQRKFGQFMSDHKGYHASIADLEKANEFLESEIKKARRRAKRKRKRIGD